MFVIFPSISYRSHLLFIDSLIICIFEFHNMRQYWMFQAADSRNRADWLLGVNSSYAICKAVGFGNNSLGRVQTPVLAEICRRYRERENFLPADSWQVFVSLCKDRQIIKLRHTEDFQEYRYASELYGDCKAVRNARIAAVNRESEDIRAPAPYNLTELQKDANRYHNLTAIQVQDITQGLYEKKLISYPRTASRLLTRDVYDTLPAVMEKILSRKEFRQYAKMTDFAAFGQHKEVMLLKHKCPSPRIGKKPRGNIGRWLYAAFLTATLSASLCQPASAATVWEKANEIMRDVYTQILGISTIAAIVTAAVALLMMNFSRSGRTVDESRAWLKRIIITWAVLNGLGFIMSYVTPFFSGGQWTAP